MANASSRVMANATRAGTTLLRSCLCRSAVAVRPFAHLRILYAGPGCKSGPAGFKAGQAFTAVYNRASRLYSRLARFKTGRPAIKPAAGFQAGQVYNRALTYICKEPLHFHSQLYSDHELTRKCTHTLYKYYIYNYIALVKVVIYIYVPCNSKNSYNLFIYFNNYYIYNY